MVVTETDINESLKTLAQDAENARLYGSPPDAIVMRAIELGMGTRAELRRATGFGYDVIEKCLERLSSDISFQTVGEIERFERVGAGVNKNPDYICVDCKGPRSYGSGQRCKKCYDAKAAANQRPRKPGLDVNDLAHQEAQRKIEQMVARGKQAPQSTSNGDSVIHESVKAEGAPAIRYCFCGREQPPNGTHRGTHRNKAERRPGVTHGAPPVPLDYDEIENLRAAGMAIEEISLKLGHAKSTLNNRRGSDKRLNDALNNGLERHAANGNGALSKTEKNITETITTELCFCGREQPVGGKHRGTHRNQASGNGHDAVRKETKVRTEIVQPKALEIVEPDKKQDSNLPVKMTPQQFIERFNSFDDFEIEEFFNKLNEQSTDSGIVWGVLPEEPKHTKQFFSVAYNVLVTMLDDGMSTDQKQSVWTLICYMKRLQKDGFGG